MFAVRHGSSVLVSSVLVVLALVSTTAAPATAATAAPQGVHVTIVGATSIQWSWDAFPNASRYRVAVSAHRDMSSPVVRWTAGRWVTAQFLERRSVYYVSVRAESAAGLSDPSPIVAGVTSPVPVGLRSIEQTSTKLTWTWIEFKDSTRYEIRLSSDPGFRTWRSRIVSSSVPMYWYGLEASRTYYAMVRGLNQDWTPFTGWSAVKNATTTAAGG